MKTVLRWLAALTIPFLLTTAAVAKDYREGDGYTVLANPQPTSSGEKIEVLELFWYGCPHCYDLEPYIRKWLDGKPDDVVFVRLPAIVGPRWELLAKAYFTAELLGVLDKVHPALFDAIHAEHREINDEGALEAFFVEQGVATEDFRGTFNSFAVAVKTNTAKMKTRQYAITGVPTVIVNGKYSTSGRQAGSNQGIIDVVRYLIKQERSTGKADAG
ncbi:MAG: thiol:disulfide interchange protein DsbA/DsbL [Gammaproteobacteria bacterium]|jgi:thiol:disulfide interchange protein DsbA